jgi:excisionase family DNA binding protein
MGSNCEREVLTVRDVCSVLQIGPNSAYTLLNSGAFPVIRIGRSYRVPRGPFFEWLTRQPAASRGVGISKH